MSKLTVEQALELVYKTDPATVSEFRDLGIHLLEIHRGSGAFRDVYKVRGLPVVVKIPKNRTDSVDHSVAEYTAVYRIMKFKKYKLLKKYMPEILYFNGDTGVTVMPYYKTCPYSVANNIISNMVDDLVTSVWTRCWNQENSTDICCGNIAIDEDEYGTRQIKIIDLGCFLEN